MSRQWSRSSSCVGAAVALLVLLSACGLPGEGSVSQVDDETVPYGLLESEASSSADPDGLEVPGPGPVVFWLSADDRLVPSATDASCDQPAEAVVESLLSELVAGPTVEDRDAGRSTAIPPESALALVEITEDGVQVEIQSETSISAERLPAAVGQIVLTLTSVAGVDSVTLVSDAVPVPVPLPGGALTDSPVTDDDYDVLVPDRYQEQPGIGCPDA